MLDGSESKSPHKASGYAWYVLIVLVFVYILNFVDRQILSILAEDVKRDLELSDADLGFLYGTAFGVFYALFAIPLGRLADSWNRVRLMSVGLTIWSSMTALSGFAWSGLSLAGARFGVGIGEATANPCAYSILSDYFPKEKRATALAIYSSGLYLGAGLSLFVGGYVVKNWNLAYAGGPAPLGLVGWQAAFLAVGLPGLVLAILVSTLKEPLRGQSDGNITPVSATPFRDFVGELSTVIPPFTVIGAARLGFSSLMRNLLSAVIAAIAAAGMIKLTGDVAQWCAIGVGWYAVFSWANALKQRDLPTYTLIWKTPAFLFVTVGYGFIAFGAYSVSFWAAPYALRMLGADPAVAGFWIGGSGAAGGFLGVILGGRFADYFRKSNPSGRIIICLIGAIAPILPLVIAMFTHNLSLYYALQLPMTALSSCALGASAATALDLVLPRMRGAATATFLIGASLIGLALGPYTVGKISALTGDLATGLLSLLFVAPISVTCFVLAYRLIPQAEASLVDRARVAGENV